MKWVYGWLPIDDDDNDGIDIEINNILELKEV